MIERTDEREEGTGRLQHSRAEVKEEIALNFRTQTPANQIFGDGEQAGSIEATALWSIFGTLGWILTRQLEVVVAFETKLANWKDWLGKPPRDVWGQDLLSVATRYCKNQPEVRACALDAVASAVASLITRLQQGKLEASGYHRKQAYRRMISRWTFADARLVFSPRDGVRILQSTYLIAVDREQVVTLWPPPEPTTSIRLDARGNPRVISMAAAERECVQWLLEQFRSDRFATKAELRQVAVRQVFHDRLSGRSFLKAWQEATERFPDRRVSGPKRR